MYRLHADDVEHQASETVRRRQHRTLRPVFLPANVVSRMYGEVVCEPTRPVSAGDLDVLSVTVSDLQGTILYGRHLSHHVIVNYLYFRIEHKVIRSMAEHCC